MTKTNIDPELVRLIHEGKSMEDLKALGYQQTVLCRFYMVIRRRM